jgi:hypothetical protein
MLIPEEQPYQTGLNSYYIAIDRFVEHLQGEIGSGCLYCLSAKEEVLIYFDEHEVIRGIIQKNGEPAYTTHNMDPVLKSLGRTNFQLTVFAMDPNAIFFWGQIPPFKRAKKILTSKDIRLPDLLYRLNSKNFYGFVQVQIVGQQERAILFLHKGSRIGGSYSWGRGGLDPSDSSYNQLLKLVQKTPAQFTIGHFQAEAHTHDPRQQDQAVTVPGTDVKVADLDRALELFLNHFVQIIRKKSKSEPIVLLKQEFMDKLDVYPFLDPFKDIFDYVDGRVHCSDEVSRDTIADGVVDCAWNVIKAHRLEKKFRAALSGCESKDVLAACNITVAR